MADSAQKKNKKNKKKQDASVASVSASINDKAISSVTISNNCTQKNIIRNMNSEASEKKEALPPDSVCVQGGESTNKKKKKNKKKCNDMSKEVVNENNKSGSLLNFSKNGIQLLNHPEISVTISDPSESKEEEAKGLPDNIPPLDKDKEVDNSNTASSKKKKKKKKKPSESVPVDSPVSNETTIVTPTYTKVVTSDNTCVLVVNNEKFSVDSKSFDSSENIKSKVSENSINFRFPSEKQLGDVLLTKNFTPDTTMNFSNSVSIFPVLTTNSLDSKQSVCTNHNLEMNSSDLKEETSDPSGKENVDESKPSKAQLKAERRAKQEAQRAAKLAKGNVKADSNTAKPVENKSNTPKEKNPMKESNSKVDESNEKNLPAKIAVEKEALHKVKLFSHLPQFKKFNIDEKIHPAVLEVGFQYIKGIICGSNARCIALLHALKEVIKDHTPLPDKNFCRDLESSLQANLNYLSNCRPLSVSMINAVKFLKYQINHLPSNLEVDQVKEKLCSYINSFVKEDILVAKEAICNVGSFKIVNGDVILVFAYSSLVVDVLNSAHNKKKSFRVIVVDSRPKVEGLKMLQSLVKQGIHCSYTSINAISYVMKEVTKVYLGAHALLANGCVISRIGNKQIALMAMSYSVPVFVCCETYKFCERVLTDSFVHNELGDPDDVVTPSLVSNESLKNWHDLPSLQPLNLLYDLITPDLIFEVVTEKGAFPCNAVPVLLRVRYAGLHD